MPTEKQIRTWFPQVDTIDPSLLDKLNKTCLAYDKLMLKIENTEWGSVEHSELIKQEKKLHLKNVHLRKALNIYIPDPCKGKPCLPYKEVMFKGKLSKRGCPSMGENNYCNKFKIFLTVENRRIN